MTKAKKVLVIDDDRAACDLIARALGRRGIEVSVSFDADSGLETARTVMPDLVFMNLLLSGTNGLKVSKSLHSIKGLEKTPVIMLISYEGELDPKYTVTIGIVDILVKPVVEEDLVIKTTAVIGDLSAPEPPEETGLNVSDEGEAGLFMSDEEPEMKEEAALTEAVELMDESQNKDHIYDSMEKILTLDEISEEGGPDMPRKDKPFDKKEKAFDEKDLFSEDEGLFSDELKKSFDEVQEAPEQEEREDVEMPEDYVEAQDEEKPATSLRKILIIAASIIAGIALGVGGYFFFTAGNRQTPPRKEVASVQPEPSAVSPAPEALPGKPDVIPEVQVKPELQSPEEKQPKGSALQEPAPKAGAMKEEIRSEPGKSVKGSPPVEAAKSGQQKPATAGKQAKKNKAPAEAITNGTFYVQAGLFENENNAKALIDRIRLKGFPVSVKKVEKPEGKTLYRVTVGSYASIKEARGVSEALNKQGILTIVQRQQ